MNTTKGPVPLTLHVRLTKACNADCSYCSSWQENPDRRMSPEDYLLSIDNLIKLIKELELGTKSVSIQYIGGEILLIPLKELEAAVTGAREKFENAGIAVRDGVQTNLIGSKDKILYLNTLFNGNLGTSVDRTSGARTVNKSADQYNLIFSTRDTDLYDGFKRTPAVYTFDQSMIGNVHEEYQIAEREGRNLTVKGVFEGGKGVKSVSSADFYDTMANLYDSWIGKGNIILEPFYSMMTSHLKTIRNQSVDSNSCHFQADCASRSFSIEPNGDLYICQDLADKDFGKLGNMISNNFNLDVWNQLYRRPEMLDDSCKACPYVKSCQGGCMVESIEAGKGVWGKTNNCVLWKYIFSDFEERIKSDSNSNLERWLRRLSVK